MKEVITKNLAKKNLKMHPRAKESHKGNFGHALIIAGNRPMIGACVLAVKACLRSGVGLVTTHIPKCGYEIVKSSCLEGLVSLDKDNECWTSMPMKSLSSSYQEKDCWGKYNGIGIGPGLGLFKKTKEIFKKFLKQQRKPIVMDADALNILATNRELLKLIPENSILTPHVREFERLYYGYTNVPRKDNKGQNIPFFYESLQKEFSKKMKVIVVLKGYRTRISCPDGKLYENSTGNSGMAKGGAGDILTGLLTGLLAQGYSPKDTAIFGVYLHGLAGDIAAKKMGQYAMIASDIIENLGNAFLETMN